MESFGDFIFEIGMFFHNLGNDIYESFDVLSEKFNWSLVFGIIAFILAAKFYGKGRGILKVIFFILAIIFMTLGCIKQWVGLYIPLLPN